MGKHILFLLKSDFFDGDDSPFFCPHSAVLEGLLNVLPELETKLVVRRVEYKRPRPEMIEILGEENQDTSVLVIDETQEVPAEAQVSSITGRSSIVGEIELSKFLHKNLGTIRPH